MKTLLYLISVCSLLVTLPLSATPDWSTMSNETFIGSNDQVYALMKTSVDNQGNYYSSRHVKTILEYSKSDNAIINQEIVSDIVYNIDVDHLDPNTPPKVTKVIKAQNKKLLLSTLTIDYDKPAIPTVVPEWTKRLSWENDGIYLDEKLLIISKDDITDKDLPYDKMHEEPIAAAIDRVFHDQHCIYISLKYGEAQNYENSIIRIEASVSKQINDWSTKLTDYLKISEHTTKELANEASLKLIKTCNEKDYYALNLEIWSAESAPGKVHYLVVHRPFDLPMDANKIKTLDSIIKTETKTVKSTDFIQKWIPFTMPEDPPEPTDPEAEPTE